MPQGITPQQSRDELKNGRPTIGRPYRYRISRPRHGRSTPIEDEASGITHAHSPADITPLAPSILMLHEAHIGKLEMVTAQSSLSAILHQNRAHSVTTSLISRDHTDFAKKSWIQSDATSGTWCGPIPSNTTYLTSVNFLWLRKRILGLNKHS